MSDQTNRRQVILAATGIAATIVVILAYRKYTQAATAPHSSLHRSNAVRRSRRRWRRGFTPQTFEENPVDTAVISLEWRSNGGRPYGRYNNRLLFEAETEALESGLFDLLPRNLPQIYGVLANVRPLSDAEKRSLQFHIHALFVQNFLQEEFPAGWIIGHDVERLVQLLCDHGVDETCVRLMADHFDHGTQDLSHDWDVRTGAEAHSSGNIDPSDGPIPVPSTEAALEALVGAGHSDSSDDSSADDDDGSDPGGSQNMLDLLYHIARQQADREGFIHRNVRCNSCGVIPIQGIRFQCANCHDFDLCEDCEAQQIHNKSHIFYKIRIPAPPRSHIKQPVPVLYPGLPNAFPSSMPSDLQRRLVLDTGMDKTEMEASYEQFKCLAGEQIPLEDDPAKLGMAISRQNFNVYFTPSSADRPPAPNLIHDRIFAYYDFHNDGVITLDEYIISLWGLTNKSRGARLRRMFMGYDLDADGFVDRKDFLRIFRAHYAISRDLIREMMNLQDELNDDIRDVVRGSQPISAAFGAPSFVGHASRPGQGKEVDSDGDLVIASGPQGVLRSDTDMRGNRARAIGNRAVQGMTRTHPFRSFRQAPPADEPLMSPPSPVSNREDPDIMLAGYMNDDSIENPDVNLHVYGWPPRLQPEMEDVVEALGADVLMEDIIDPVDRSRVIYAQMERLDAESDKFLNYRRSAAVRESWRRRQFGLDEEEGFTKPPGFEESDSSGDEVASIDEQPVLPTAMASTSATASRRQSMRSRSSSKVRFDDSAIDTDHETRSNTSSRSVPLNERWGGFELSGPEKDIGREVMYQAVQQGFNELLDPIFKAKEDAAMEAIASKNLRIKYAKELEEHKVAIKRQMEEAAHAVQQADALRTQELFSTMTSGISNDTSSTTQATQGQLQTSTARVEHNEVDQTHIMAGNSPAKPTPSASVAVPTQDSLIHQQVNEQNMSSESDPTLPQNKPNDPTVVIQRSGILKSALPASALRDSSIPSLSRIPPPPEILTQWLQHRQIDTEAKKRGGYGKLSYREFCRIIIGAVERQRNPEIDLYFGSSTRDPGTNARDEQGGSATHSGASGGGVESSTPQRRPRSDDVGKRADVDKDPELTDDELERAWSSTGDLGKWNFLDTWLEMAQF